MKVKLFILFSILIVLLGFAIFYYGFPMLNPKHKPGNKTVQPSVRRVVEQFSPYYTAAVVEIEMFSDGRDETPTYINQMVDIINSRDVKEADIVLLSEALLNRNMAHILLPNSTIPCDDPNAHYTFRNISCAARNAKKYVAMNMYTRIICTDDDHMFCVDLASNTNIYNMMFIFDRKGAIIAKYRKYNPCNEDVQVTDKPEIVTFQTDFNVTFGLMACLDILLDAPGNMLVQSGLRHIIFSTLWHNQLPFGISVQYQQSWAYGHNVNLLAANTNWPAANTTGSGIYAGRFGAQKVFFSEIPTTKILVARLPINLPSENETQFIKPDEDVKVFPQKDLRVMDDGRLESIYDEKILQDGLESVEVEFLDFTTSTNFSGTVCQNSFCCNYDIEISKNTGANVNNGPSYLYAVSVFDDFYQLGKPRFMRTKQSICCVIACPQWDGKPSCGKRYSGKVNYPYSIDKINLKALVQMDRESKILPTTLTYDLYPMNVGDFDFEKQKLEYEEKYLTSMNLKTPRSDLLTFGFIGRDYKSDASTLNDLIAIQQDQAFTGTNTNEMDVMAELDQAAQA